MSLSGWKVTCHDPNGKIEREIYLPVQTLPAVLAVSS
jgi:hypothetical protein